MLKLIDHNIDISMRYGALAALVHKLAGSTNTLRVLDVGGLGSLQTLLPEASVCSLNPDPQHFTGVVRGDGRAIPFADQHFDVVVLSDVLEHVPASDRPQVLAESARVSRDLLLVSGPLDNADAIKQDRYYDGLYQQLFGVRNPWMIQHDRFGRPPRSLFELPAGYKVAQFIGLTPVALLQLTTLLDFLTERLGQPTKGTTQATNFVLRNFEPLEQHGPVYRHVWIARRERDLAAATLVLPRRPDFADRLVALMPLVVQSLREVYAHYTTRYHSLPANEYLVSMRHHIPELQREAARLQQQAEEAEREVRV